MTDQSKLAASRIPSLTGLRALAALGVLFCHFSEINTDRNDYFNWGYFDKLFIHGGLGVDVFFALSGFILVHVYKNTFSQSVAPREWLRFIQFRIARIYPVHLLTMAGMAMLFFIGKRFGAAPHHAEAFTLPSVIANFAMMHAWFPGFVYAINGPAWSISAEWFAYLLFPTFYCLTSRLENWAKLGFLMALLTLQWFSAKQTPIEQILVDFPIGVLAYSFTPKTPFRDTLRFGSILGFGIILASLYWVSNFDLAPSSRIEIGPHARSVILLGTSVLLVTLPNPRDLIGKLLALPWAVFAGEISYSVYMCHWTIWTILHKGAEHSQRLASISHPVLMLSAFLITLVVSTAVYKLVEMPGRRFLRTSTDRRTRQLSTDSITA